MKKIFMLIVASIFMATTWATAQDGTPYTALAYSTTIPVNGTEVTGSLTPATNLVMGINGYDWVARDCKFSAKSGKCYKFTATFTTEERFYSDAFIYMLNNVLIGDEMSDLLQVISKYGNEDSQLTLTGTFVATANKDVKLLIGSCDFVSLDYKIKIEEVATPPSYKSITYDRISFNTPINNTLNETNNALIDPEFKYVNGKGYMFSAKAGKSYKIACTYSSEEAITFNSGFYLLTGGELAGNEYDILYDAFNYSDWEWNTEITVTHRYNTMEDHDVRILLTDRGLNNLNYSFTIEEITVPSYTEIAYSELAVNKTVNSTLTTDNIIIDPTNYFSNGKGYSFYATEGKHYQITCNFFSYGSIYNVGFYLLKALTGSEIDIIDHSHRLSVYDGNVTEYYTYTATHSGDVRLLLYGDSYGTDLIYSIQMKEVSSPDAVLTLKQLLDNIKPENVINYSNNLSYTSNGIADNYVSGLELSPMRYYAAAYKITLAVGNHIKIHSSKESDSVLYLYVSDGVGGYTCIDYNDDDYENYYDGDSFLEYTATAANTYYIVVSDFYKGKSGNYFLTVWNTAEEPENVYPEGIEISSVTPSANSISVNIGADETEIRMALMNLTLTGVTSGGSVKIVNNAFAWFINSSEDGTTELAICTPFYAPIGYYFSSDVWDFPASVIINYVEAGIKNIQETSAVVYTLDRNIIVRDAEMNSRLLVTDITGRIIANTIVKTSETNIPVKNNGVYIVSVGKQRVKVIVK